MNYIDVIISIAVLYGIFKGFTNGIIKEITNIVSVCLAIYLGFHFYSLLVQNPQGYLNEHPLWLISPGLLLAGLIFICFGIIGEFLIHLLSPQLFDNYVQKRVGFSIPKDTSFD